MTLIEQIETLLRPPLAQIGAMIAEISLKLEQGTHVLHIAVSRTQGRVDLDFIVKVTELVSPLLDESALIDHRYVLDVSSAGIERSIPLSELSQHIGDYLAVTLRKPYRTENVLEAYLKAIHPDTIILEGFIKGKKYQAEISIADIDKVREAIKF